MNAAKFVELYKIAEDRAQPAAAGRGGNGGKAFQFEDRLTLVAAMHKSGYTPGQLGFIIDDEIGGGHARHSQRLRNFELQIQRGGLVMGLPPVTYNDGLNQSGVLTLGFAAPAKPAKVMTVDVCHQLVAYDCELGSLQAQLDNLRELHAEQEAQLEANISQLTTEMNSLKAEYNVE